MRRARLALQCLMPLTITPPRHPQKGCSSSIYNEARRHSTLRRGSISYAIFCDEL